MKPNTTPIRGPKQAPDTLIQALFGPCLCLGGLWVGLVLGLKYRHSCLGFEPDLWLREST